MSHGKLYVLFIFSLVFLACLKSKNGNSLADLKPMHDEIKVSETKTFIVYSSFIKDDYIKHAIIIQKGDMEKKKYLEIDLKKIKNKKGKVIIDGNEYGNEFYAWRIEIDKDTIYINPYWNLGNSTTDPIIFEYNSKTDQFEEYKIDESEY